MSGWRRLWIVLSIIAGIPAFMVALSEDRLSIYESAATKDEMQAILETSMAKITEQCSSPPARIKAEFSYDRYTFYFSCDRNAAWVRALFWAMLPGLAMAAIGLTVRWIYRGFKPKPAPPAEA